MIGQAVNRSTSAVDVTFGVAGAPTPATVAVPASSGKTLSDAATGVEIPGIPAAPGEMVEMTVTTAEAGENIVTVPVLAEHRLLPDLTARAVVTRVAVPGLARGSGLELVAQPPHGDDVRRVGRVGLDLRPQPLDVHVEGLGVADVVGAPDPVDQLHRGSAPGRRCAAASRAARTP